MKKIILSFAAVLVFCLTACADRKTEQKQETSRKALVVFFSATGTTADAAQRLAAAAGAELYEIKPAKPYTSADLDWRDHQSRCFVEMHNLSFRPALKSKKDNIADYDVIYLGYPIWWNIAPTIVNSFIEAHGMKGKTVVPFATSGGSGIDNSVKELRKAYPDINWKDGALLNNADETTLGRLLTK